MKKAKKIGLSLNKKIVSKLQKQQITGGGSGLNMPVHSCGADGGCYGQISQVCSDPRMTTYDCPKQ